MKKLILALTLFAIGGTAAAQSAGTSPALDYSFLELRFVDADNDGDGFRLGGSYDLDNTPFILVGSLTGLDFGSSVDVTTFEVGGGYVLPYDDDFDLFGTVRFVNTEVDTPFGDADDNGFAVSLGTRGLLTPQFEVRGSVNHINLDNSDTFIELAGDYYFTPNIAAGFSFELAGDLDIFSFGARWYFE